MSTRFHSTLIRFRSVSGSLHKLQERHWSLSFVHRGVRLAREGQYASAIEQYDTALINMPNCVDAYVARGAAKANLVLIILHLCHN